MDDVFRWRAHVIDGASSSSAEEHGTFLLGQVSSPTLQSPQISLNRFSSSVYRDPFRETRMRVSLYDPVVTKSASTASAMTYPSHIVHILQSCWNFGTWMCRSICRSGSSRLCLQSQCHHTFWSHPSFNTFKFVRHDSDLVEIQNLATWRS